MKIIVENAEKKYKNKLVIDNFNYVFESGNAYGIIGRNGSGKTQLLKAICGHIKLNSGKVMQDDTIIRNKDNFILSAGIIVDSPGFLDNVTCKENLEKIRLIKNETSKNEMLDFINMFELDEHLNKKYKNLSLGNKQKMLIIQALIDNPEILILDEPFNSLDNKTCKILRKYLIDYKKRGIIIMTSHYDEDLSSICDYIINIEEGKIV